MEGLFPCSAAVGPGLVSVVGAGLGRLLFGVHGGSAPGVLLRFLFDDVAEHQSK